MVVLPPAVLMAHLVPPNRPVRYPLPLLPLTAPAELFTRFLAVTTPAQPSASGPRNGLSNTCCSKLNKPLTDSDFPPTLGRPRQVALFFNCSTLFMSKADQCQCSQALF